MESISAEKQNGKTDDEFLKALERFKGSAKVKISDEELHETREKVLREFIKEKGWKLD